MCLRGLRTLGLCALVGLQACLLLGGLGTRRAMAQDGVPEQLTVVIDLMVEDAKGRPVRNLTPEEIIISQEAVQQRVARLEAGEVPGRYELSYVPASGKAGPVLLQFLRPGAAGHDPGGPGLKPRIVLPPSALEATLAQALKTRPDADDFPSSASVMHFDAAPDGTHFTLALEVPLSGLAGSNAKRPSALRLQILSRVREAATGRVVRRFEVDRSVAANGGSVNAQRLVWTGQTHLPRGRYLMETVAYDPVGVRASVRMVPFEATDPTPGLGLGSLALIQPAGGLMVRAQGDDKDDPFVFAHESLMPTFDLKTVAAPGATVDFFTVVYPDRSSADPVTLTLEVLRDGKVIQRAPVPLPAAGPGGEIRYAGGIPTESLEPGQYSLRANAQQGAAARVEEVSFVMLAGSTTAPIRVGPVASATSESGVSPSAGGGVRTRSGSAEAPEVATARLLIRRQKYDEAVRGLQKADAAANGQKGDIVLMLGVANYRLGAYKDAEAALLRVIALDKGDHAYRGQATFLLGRVLAAGEKKPVRRDSAPLHAAEEAFRHTLNMPEMSKEPTQIALAETLIRLDQLGEARELLDALLKDPEVSDSGKDRARQLESSPRCATEACLPSLSYVTSDGRRQTTDDLRGKAVLLSFWATWCEPCVAALPDLKQVYRLNEKGPFVMLGINMHDDRGAMDKFLDQNEIGWPQVAGDVADRVIEDMAVQGIPTEMIFDHEGVLVSSTMGWRPGRGQALLQETGRTVSRAKKQASLAGAPR